MKYAVLGATGWQGAGVTVRLVAAGEQVLVGSRTLSRSEYVCKSLPKALDLPAENFIPMTNIDAAKQADIIFVVVPITGHHTLLEEIKPFVEGKIIVDVTAPVNPKNQLENLWPKEGSATQEAQKILDGVADVVGALKNISATALLNFRKPYNGEVLVIGDDLTSKSRVMNLLRKMKLNSYDVGSGEVCRTVEGLTQLLIYLAMAYHLRQPGIKIAEIDFGLDFIPAPDLLPQ